MMYRVIFKTEFSTIRGNVFAWNLTAAFEAAKGAWGLDDVFGVWGVE